MTVPPSAERLFFDVSPSALESEDAEGFVVIRLLDVGDSTDLRGLFSQLSEPVVCRHFIERGSRQLDRRSRALWSLLLDADPGDGSPLGEDFWGI